MYGNSDGAPRSANEHGACGAPQNPNSTQLFMKNSIVIAYRSTTHGSSPPKNFPFKDATIASISVTPSKNFFTTRSFLAA